MSGLTSLPRPTRREALVSIAAVGFSASALQSQQSLKPVTFPQKDYALLGDLVDLIVPASDTPGAKEAGVHAVIDEEIADKTLILNLLQAGFQNLRMMGFESMSQADQISLLTRISKSSGEDREFFETLKCLTLDVYYSTEIGLVRELGYKGNTYLTEFPGCTHQHEIEDIA